MRWSSSGKIVQHFGRWVRILLLSYGAFGVSSGLSADEPRSPWNITSRIRYNSMIWSYLPVPGSNNQDIQLESDDIINVSLQDSWSLDGGVVRGAATARTSIGPGFVNARATVSHIATGPSPTINQLGKSTSMSLNTYLAIESEPLMFVRDPSFDGDVPSVFTANLLMPGSLSYAVDTDSFYGSDFRISTDWISADRSHEFGGSSYALPLFAPGSINGSTHFAIDLTSDIALYQPFILSMTFEINLNSLNHTHVFVNQHHNVYDLSMSFVSATEDFLFNLPTGPNGERMYELAFAPDVIDPEANYNGIDYNQITIPVPEAGSVVLCSFAGMAVCFGAFVRKRVRNRMARTDVTKDMH